MSNNSANDTNQVWVRVCPLTQIAENKAANLVINGQRLIVTRCGDSAQVLQGYCSHMLFPLGNSAVDNCVLTCGLHRSKFSLTDGSVLEWSTFPPVVGNALAAIRQRKSLRTFATRVTDGDVYVQWAAQNPDEVRVSL